MVNIPIGMNDFTHTLVILVSATVVISSTGEVAQLAGELLGQYEYDEDKEYYVQSSTEQSNDQYIGRYLYYLDDYKVWVVGPTPGGKTDSWSTSKELTGGWVYADGEAWKSDPSLTVTPGPLPSLPSQFTVTASGAAAEKFPSYLGVYNKTERWWSGRPVYVNTHGRFLFHTFTVRLLCTEWIIYVPPQPSL